MKCIVANCKHDSSAPNPLGVTYYMFPPEPSLREKWLRALHSQGCAEDSIVCSDHFLAKDLFLTNSGQYLLRTDAVPVLPNMPSYTNSPPLCDVKVCRICFATDCKLYSMINNKQLNLAYQSLAGLMTDSENELPAYLCTICAHRLLNAASFKTKCLQANLLLLDVVKKHKEITLKTLKSAIDNRTPSSLTMATKINHYDLNIIQVKKETEDTLEDVALINEERNILIVEIYNNERINESQAFDKTQNITNINLTNKMLSQNAHTDADNDIVDANNDINAHNDFNAHNDIDANNDVNAHNEFNAHNDIDANNDVNAHNDFNAHNDINDHSDINAHNDVDANNDKNNDAGGPVVVYIKTEAIENEVNSADEDLYVDDQEFNEGENSILGMVETIDDENGRNVGDSSTNDTQLKIKEQPNMNSSKIVNFTSRDGHTVRQPMLKTVHFDKSNHLVPRIVSNPFRKRKKYSLKPGEKYCCDVCNKTFEHKGNLRKHMKIHNGVKPHSCDICQKSFILKCKLDRHVLTHYEKKKFDCKLCNQFFRSQSNLVMHMRVHDGEKPYSCEQCGSAYKDRRDLRKHMKKHLGIKPYSCEVCNKSFIIKNKLMRHVLIHSDVKPFPCDVCKKSFRDKSNLLRHSRMHTGIRPFSCELCNKSYTEKFLLKAHMRIHTGENPYYMCDICKRAFTTKGNFVVHMKSHAIKNEDLNISTVPEIILG